jgi:putative aldouronate transport system substrate-binding protein
MYKMKKLFCLAMVVFFAFVMFAGCGQQPATVTPATTAEETKAVEPTKPALDPYEVTWYFVGNGQPKDMPLVEAEANKYLKDKINATIKITCFDWGSYEQKITAMIASGEPFDICFTAIWINNYRVNAAKGAFLPLNDLFDKVGPKTKELLGKDFLAGSAIDGKNYAIPCNKEKAHNWGFIFRQDLVEKYSLDIKSVKKLADLEPMLKVIKEKEKGIYPLGIKDGETPYQQLDWDKIGDDDVPGALYPDNRDSKIVNEFETPEAKAMFEQLHAFYKAGYIRKDAAAAGESYAPDQKAGKMFVYSASLKPGKDAEMTNQGGGTFKWIQQDITPPVMSNRETTGSMMAISKTSKNPERAMMFLELFNTDPVLNNLINFGIEGTHYTKKSDTVIDLVKDSGYKEMVGMQWALGNQFLNYLLPNEDPKKWEKFLEFNTKALPLKSLGFSFNMEPVKTEAAACKAVYKEFMPQLDTGTADPNVTLPKFTDKLKKAGVDKIIAEMQAQYDKWLAANGKK